MRLIYLKATTLTFYLAQSTCFTAAEYQEGNTQMKDKSIKGERVRELALRLLTPKQIAGIVGGDAKLIRTKFKQEYRQGRLVGRGRLRERMFKLAVEGNDVEAQIFLMERLVDETHRYKDSEIKELFPEIWQQVAMMPLDRGRKPRFKKSPARRKKKTDDSRSREPVEET
jgi:hypothetical protein